MKFWAPVNVIILGTVLFLTLSLIGTANATVNSSTGNLVWDECLGFNTNYTWNALSFSGFFYDFDTGDFSEKLTIQDISRNIDEGDLEYVSTPVISDFEYDNWGSYQLIAFMGESYFAGYEADSSELFDKDISFIKEGVLAKVLVDSDDKESIYTGSSLALENGYSLKIAEVDVNGDSIRVRLEKNGNIVKNQSLSSGDDFVYEADLGGADDVPIIIVHFGTVFAGQECHAVFVEGIIQISDYYIEIENGDTFGEMKVSTINEERIKLENKKEIDLDKGSTIGIIGRLKLKVADSETLRFAPVWGISELEKYEFRGTVYDEDNNFVPFSWTPLNFEGFYYNLDRGVGTEELRIEKLEDREIPESKLVYTSTVHTVDFEYEEWGDSPVIGLFGDKYVPLLSEGEDVHLARVDRFSSLVMDSEDKYTLRNREVLDLGSGYALEAKQVDVNGNKIWLEFTRNGEFVDDEVVDLSNGQSGSWIVDLDNIGNKNDVVVLRVHVNKIFQGAVDSLAQIQGIWLIDYDNVFTIENGDVFDEFEVTDIEEGLTGENPKFAHLELRNKNSILLNRDYVQNILRGVKFRIADSDPLRFYPFVKASSEGAEIVYKGSIEEGSGYRLNNYVIEITDVFVEANTASYVLKLGENVKTGLLDAGESMEFDFEGDGKVRMRLISVYVGGELPGVLVEITVSGYDVNELYANGVIEKGSPHETYTMYLQKGWNLVSTPIVPDYPNVNSIFGNHEDVILPVYTWSPANRQYYSVNTIGIGNGYWVLALDDTRVTFIGTQYSM